MPQLTEEVEPHPASVPAFLPPFPPKHTYRETPVRIGYISPAISAEPALVTKRPQNLACVLTRRQVVEEFKPDVKEVRKQKAKGKRQVESSLHQLTAKFTTRSVRC